MDNHQQLNEIKQASPYLVVYSTFWGCTYHFFYWSKFNINPFPYLGPGEILTLSVKFFAITAALVIMILLGQLFLFSSEATEERMNKEARELKTSAKLIFLASAVAIYFAQNTPYLYFAIISCGTILITPISSTSLFRSSFSSRAVRIAIAALVVALPLFAIVTAQTEANDILNKQGKTTMIRRVSGTCQSGCALIGKLGDYFSVFGSNGKIIMIKTEEMKMFEIYEFNFPESKN